MNEDDKKQYLEFAKSLALEAGEVMLRYFLHTDPEWKADQTPLTIADTTINRMVIEKIAEIYPDHSVLGEEESAMRDEARYTWVCDPVDGTMPYSHGLPISTFSLALCDNGVPIVGVVYDPFMDRLFSAATGEGAYCNNERIHVNQNPLKNALIDVEALDKSFIDMDYSVRDVLNDKEAKTTQLWSAIVAGALVASGKYSAILFFITKPEDGAALRVIVEEAGGKVTDLFGNDQRYDQPTKGFIASNGLIHDELVSIVKGVTR